MSSTRVTFGLVITGLFLSLLLPGTSLQWFDGIPISGILEIVALAVVILIAVLRQCREIARSFFTSMSSRTRLAVVFLVAFLLAVKVSFFFFVPTHGEYEACFRHLDSDPAEECVPEFASPLSYGVTRRGGEFLGAQRMSCPDSQSNLTPSASSRITRTDRQIDFGPLFPGAKTLDASSWNINFINSFRYDRGYWPWEPDDRDIQRVGFEAQWRGLVNVDQGQSIRVNYVGQGMVFLDGDCVELAPSYERASSLELKIEGGTSEIIVLYLFDEPAVDYESRGPYASIQLQLVDGLTTSNLEVDSSTILRLATILWDLVFATIILLAVLILVRKSRSQVLRSTVVVAFVGVAGWIDLSIGFKFFGLFEVTVVALILILLIRTLYQGRPVLPVGAAVILASWTMLKAEFAAFLGFTIPASFVPVRLRGNDQLVYHALAQEMLQSGFLRGAEDIFYFQPGIRYVFYVLQVIFGSGIVVYGTLILATMLYALIWFTDQLKSTDMLSRVTIFMGLTIAVVWWSSSVTVQSMTLGLSEFGTWPILVFAGGFVVRGIWTVPQGISLGFALAAVPWIRPNQGIAALVLVGAFLMCKRIVLRIRVALIVTFAGMLALVPIHNFVYGRVLAFLPRGHLFADQVNWSSILNVFSDDSTRVFFTDQLRGFLYLPTILRSIYSPRMGIFFYTVLFLWLCSIVVAVIQFRRDRRLTLMHLLVLAQLVPFLKYSFFRYFPIHLIAIYLAMWMVSLAVLTRSELLGGSQTPPFDPSDGERASTAVH